MSTATPLPISVSEYLHTSCEPACDYVDGFIEERNTGLFTDSEMLGAALCSLSRLEQAWEMTALPILMIQTSSTRFRIADICLVARSAPREQIIQTPPLAVLEIFSPEDLADHYAVDRCTQRLEDYRRMGVKHIWVIDPAARKGFDCSRPGESAGWIETSHFAVSGSPIYLAGVSTDRSSSVGWDLAALFAAIDEDYTEDQAR